LRCFITINADKTYSFVVRPPATSFLLKRAASIEKASTERVVARLSAKVLYELARVKHTDPVMQHMPLKRVYSMMLASARGYGFKVF
jgi:large subunit ribosomal protein L11